MYFFVPNAMVILNELYKFYHMFMRYRNILINCIIIAVKYVNIAFIFNNHIVDYNACLHNIFERFTIPKMISSTNNCKMLLEHSKCLVDILLCWLLSYNKMFVLIFLWIRIFFFLTNVDHKGIYSINKIVFRYIVMTMNWVINWKSSSFDEVSK